MTFKKKKIFAAAIAAALLAGTVPAVFSAYAVTTAAATSVSAEKEDDSDTMEKLLVEVKSRIEIPEELTEFEFSKSGKGSVTYYTFRWSTPDDADESRSLSVSISGDTIINYDYSEYSTDNSRVPSFGKLSSADIEKKALSYIAKLDPHFGDSVKLGDFRGSVRGDNVTIGFTRTANGTDVFGNGGSVTVDKNTGDLVSFSAAWWDNAELADISKAVDAEKMQSAYKADAKAELLYAIRYDSDAKKFVPTLIYSVSNDKYYDLNSAAESSYYADYLKAQKENRLIEDNYFEGGLYAEETADTAAGGDMGKMALSPAELKAVGEEKDVISKEKAESIARDNKYLPIDSSLTMKNAELYKHDESSASQGYEWSLRFTSADDKNRSAAVWVNIDAKTGAITSVSGWSDNDKEASDSSAAKSAAVNAAKDFLGAKFAEYKLNAPEKSEDAVGNFTFSRYVNGVKVADDDAYITVNADGKVTHFSCDYHNVEFPSAEAVSKDKVFASVFASDDFDCGYIGFRTMDGKTHTYPVFSMTDTYYVNAKSGEKCSYDGSDYVDEKTGYSDISGHWSEKYAEKLLEYGIALESDDGKLNPGTAVTVGKFSDLLGSVYGYYNAGRVSESEKDKPLTYLEACRMYVKAAGGEQFADAKGIYRSPFKDVSDDNENVGYFALAYSAGFASADKNGNINPDSYVSNSMILYMICNSLK